VVPFKVLSAFQDQFPSKVPIYELKSQDVTFLTEWLELAQVTPILPGGHYQQTLGLLLKVFTSTHMFNYQQRFFRLHLSQ
jgi:hypothetical protein